MTTFAYRSPEMLTPRPMVPYSVALPGGGTFDGWALVDSGADQSFLPFHLALLLGAHDVQMKEDVILTPTGYVPIPYVPGGVEVEAAGVTFRVDQLTQSQEAIFGREPFFRLFDIWFDQAGQSVTIEPIGVREAVAA